MRTKQSRKWAVVLCLLAALLLTTAALAQGQGPEPVKELPAASVLPASPADWGETPVYYSIWETEPNNGKATAQEIIITDPADVIGGDVFNGDVDWYLFYVPADGTGVLINTDAMMDGQNTDTVVKLFDSSGSSVPLTQNDDMGGAPYYDSLLFAVLSEGWYYVQVSDYPTDGNCTTTCSYEIIITRPILLSAHAANLGTANVEGIPFRSEDVMALLFMKNDYANRPQHKWVLFMDGSDIGITKPVVNIGLGWGHDDGRGSMTMGFGANQVWRDWQGISRTFKPWDWAQIGFGRVGPNTVLSTNELGYPGVEYHAGAEHGLTTATEKVDALDVNAEYAADPQWTANVFLSTTGAATVPTGATGTVKAADEDVLLSQTWDGLGWWYNSVFFDGSKVTGLAVEDIFAADYEAYARRMFLTILGTGKVLGHNVSQKDIFWLDKSGTTWVWGGMWHLPDYGWNYNLDAIDTGGN